MQNNDPTPTSQPDDEISLLDILVVIAENIKILSGTTNFLRYRWVPVASKVHDTGAGPGRWGR